MISFIALAVIISLLVTASISFIASKLEYKDWNGGVCPKCGKPLRHFDDDSQGGHGWTCDNCDYTTWVSYHRLVYKFWENKYRKNEVD